MHESGFKGLGAERSGGEYPAFVFSRAPRNIYWETTRACDLACQHCRADADPERHPDELDTAQGRDLLRCASGMGSMVVLTGGDPMKREDIFELIAYGRDQRVPMAITPATTPLLERRHLSELKRLGVMALGVSLDGSSAERHDGFRQVEGTFDRALQALGWARELGLSVQVNTTVTADTLSDLPALYELLVREAHPPVRRWSLFLLVPVGRGTELGIPTAERVEELFAWIYRLSAQAPFHLSTVEAPHYRRYLLQQKLREGTVGRELEKLATSMGFGIRDGNGVIFVSHTGEVFPAGFLPHPCLGNVKQTPLDRLYRESPFLIQLRDADQYRGRCGRCEFRWMCGGSRARAFTMLGDPFESDPLCLYQP